MNVQQPWTVYRTRFVVRARQLTEPLVFTDALGREHSGQAGDYLMETSQGFRITPQALFEDIYVPLEDKQAVAHVTRGMPGGHLARSMGTEGATGSVSAARRVLAWSGSEATHLGQIGRLTARGS